MAKWSKIELTEEERTELQSWLRSGTLEHRMVERANMILMLADGKTNAEVAEKLNTRPARVSQWRVRFSEDRIAGLMDQDRSGRPERYGQTTEQRILAALDDPVPKGYATWTGGLLAKHLGDVSKHHVWRVLRQHHIHLQRRRNWCLSTDPQFAQKAADIVALYLHPPVNAVVLSVDEKPHIQALERQQGWLRMPDGRPLMGKNHEYVRHGTTTLFAALEVATGLVKTGHFKRRRRREFLAFMNEVIADYPPDQEIHVILDNLNTHKPKTDLWLPRHPNVHFHYTPTHASWLNQIEVWFSILTRRALMGASHNSPREVRKAIDAYTKVSNQDAAPFEWRKAEVGPKPLRNLYGDLRN